MHGHCHYDRVLSWSGAKQHSRRETPLLKTLHEIWCDAPRTCTRCQGVEQFFAPGAEWYPSLRKWNKSAREILPRGRPRRAADCSLPSWASWRFYQGAEQWVSAVPARPCTWQPSQRERERSLSGRKHPEISISRFAPHLSSPPRSSGRRTVDEGGVAMTAAVACLVAVIRLMGKWVSAANGKTVSSSDRRVEGERESFLPETIIVIQSRQPPLRLSQRCACVECEV